MLHAQGTRIRARRRTVAAATLVSLALSWVVHLPSAEACQACACGDATFAVSPADGDAHTLTAQIYAATRPEKYGADGYPYQFNEWRADLTLGWSYQRSMVALRFPWLWRTLDFEGRELARTSGYGDTELAATYVFARSMDRANAETLATLGRSRFAAVHGGLSVPTGRAMYDRRGDMLPDEVQLGTGSTTLFAGINWAVGRGVLRLDGRHTAYVPLPGRFEFQVGPTFQNRVRVMVDPVPALRLGIGFYGSLASPVRYDGEAEVDTGGFAGYLDVEAEVRPHSTVTFVVGGRIPVIQALSGDHLAQPAVFFGVRMQGAIGQRRPKPDYDAGGYVL